MRIVNQITGVRASRKFGNVIVAKTTKNQLFVSPETCRALSLIEGDRAMIVEGEHTYPDGTEFTGYFIAKDPTGDNLSSKLGTYGKSIASGLQFSSAKTYDMLEGEPGFDSTWEVQGLTEDDADLKVEEGDITWYPLNHTGKVENNRGGSDDDNEDEAEDEADDVEYETEESVEMED